MPLEVVFALGVFLLAGVFAFLRGGPPEKFAALIILSWVSASVLRSAIQGPADFHAVDPMRFALDAAELIAIVVLALNANRIWPLWAAAAQLICVFGHISAMIEPGGMRRAYWMMTELPPFIQITALSLGVAAHVARQKRIGPYRSWRGPHLA